MEDDKKKTDENLLKAIDDRLTNEGQLIRNTGKNSLKSIKDKMTNEGQLVRNTGKNSLKSIKDTLNVNFERLTPLFESMSKSMSLQSGFMENMVKQQVEYTESVKRERDLQDLEPEKPAEKRAEPDRDDDRDDDRPEKSSRSPWASIGSLLGQFVLSKLALGAVGAMAFSYLTRFLSSAVQEGVKAAFPNLENYIKKIADYLGVENVDPEKVVKKGANTAIGAGLGRMLGRFLPPPLRIPAMLLGGVMGYNTGEDKSWNDMAMEAFLGFGALKGLNGFRKGVWGLGKRLLGVGTGSAATSAAEGVVGRTALMRSMPWLARALGIGAGLASGPAMAGMYAVIPTDAGDGTRKDQSYDEWAMKMRGQGKIPYRELYENPWASEDDMKARVETGPAKVRPRPKPEVTGLDKQIENQIMDMFTAPKIEPLPSDRQSYKDVEPSQNKRAERLNSATESMSKRAAPVIVKGGSNMQGGNVYNSTSTVINNMKDALSTLDPFINRYGY
jgi:hypothetical protein